MCACLVLGMGIPTIPNYIITSSIAAPALLELGVPLIVSHMFVFYFGIMADLTPPVALAAFAAAPFAREIGNEDRRAGRAHRDRRASSFRSWRYTRRHLMLQGGYSWFDLAYVTSRRCWQFGCGESPPRVLAGAAQLARACDCLRGGGAAGGRGLPLTDELGFVASAAALMIWH